MHRVTQRQLGAPAPLLSQQQGVLTMYSRLGSSVKLLRQGFYRRCAIHLLILHLDGYSCEITTQYQQVCHARAGSFQRDVIPNDLWREVALHWATQDCIGQRT